MWYSNSLVNKKVRQMIVRKKAIHAVLFRALESGATVKRIFDVRISVANQQPHIPCAGARIISYPWQTKKAILSVDDPEISVYSIDDRIILLVRRGQVVAEVVC